MNKVSPLTIEFIETLPQTAGKVLSTLNDSDASEFLEALPTRCAVTLMSKIGAWSASTLVSQMTPVNGAAVLAGMDYQTTASIMRVMPDANRAPLLSALPRKLGQDLASTLTYPADAVGAKMSTDIVAMAPDQTVGEAFSELRQLKRMKTGVAYVVDGSRKLLGIVTSDELLRLSNDSRLGAVMERSVAPISARARLSIVKSLPAWDDYAHLPVVNREKMLIGSLARRTFRDKFIEPPVDKTPTRSPTILAIVAGAFFSSSLGLAQTLTDVGVTSGRPDNEPSASAGGDNS